MRRAAPGRAGRGLLALPRAAGRPVCRAAGREPERPLATRVEPEPERARGGAEEREAMVADRYLPAATGPGPAAARTRRPPGRGGRAQTSTTTGMIIGRRR